MRAATRLLPDSRLGILRVLIVSYCLFWTVVRTPYWLDLARLPVHREQPVGVLSLFGLVLPPWAVMVGVAVALLAGAAALTGRAWTVSAPLFAVAFLVLTTHGNSWGQVLHTENLAALHLLVLAASPSPGRASDESVDWVPRALAIVTVATYFVAGVAKLRFGGTDWVSGEVLRNLVAHDNLRKDLLGDPSSPVAPYVVEHAWLFGPAAVLTVVIELAAPLALLSRRLAAAWAAAAWLFHFLILVLMAVLFLYPLLGLAFAPLFPVERLRHRARAGRPSELRSAP